MDGLAGRHDEARLEMYRRTAEEALAEIDELQTEILSAQARVTSMMGRVRALEGLVAAVHALVGPSVEMPLNLRPVRIEGLSDPEPLPLRRRDRVRLPATDEPPAAEAWSAAGNGQGVPVAGSFTSEPFDSWRAAGLRRP